VNRCGGLAASIARSYNDTPSRKILHAPKQNAKDAMIQRGNSPSICHPLHRLWHDALGFE
jgi:hypothetical protein